MGSIKQFTTSAPSPTTKMALKNKKSYEDYLLGGGVIDDGLNTSYMTQTMNR